MINNKKKLQLTAGYRESKNHPRQNAGLRKTGRGMDTPGRVLLTVTVGWMGLRKELSPYISYMRDQ